MIVFVRALIALAFLSVTCASVAESLNSDANPRVLLSEGERDRIRRSETIVLGEVTSIGERAMPGGGSCRAVTIAVETCLKGDCRDDVVTTGMLLVRGVSLPEIGHRYIFCLRWLRDAPGILWGGYGSERYELDDRVVLRPGTPSAEVFVDSILAVVAERSPEMLLQSCDVAVSGVVRDYVYRYADPRDTVAFDASRSASREISRAEIRRMQAGYVDPDVCNFVDISVEQILKGALAHADSMRVALPCLIGSGGDVPRFEAGEHVVVFAGSAQQGHWVLCGGIDSKLPVRADGSVGEYESVSALAARAHN